MTVTLADLPLLKADVDAHLSDNDSHRTVEIYEWPRELVEIRCTCGTRFPVGQYGPTAAFGDD